MIMSVSLAKNLSKQPGKQIENATVISGKHAQPAHGKLSGGPTPLPGVARLGTFEASRMPNVAARPLRSSPHCFPHAPPISLSEAGKQKTAPKGRSNKLFSLRKLERAKGFEPSTPTLARLCSTPELHPRPRTASPPSAALMTQ